MRKCVDRKTVGFLQATNLKKSFSLTRRLALNAVLCESLTMT